MPALPLAPSSPEIAGHETVVPNFSVLAQVGSESARYCENMKVSPDPSRRCTGTMTCAGSATPGFAAAIAGSFHIVILPV